MTESSQKPSIFGETPESLTERLVAVGQPRFRAGQILEWVYKKRVTDPAEMSNMPKGFREWLSANLDFSPTRLVLTKASSDVTDKLLLELNDHSMIETVVIRAPQDGVGIEHSRKTICISTQVGCAYGCKFCASGLAGWKRDLSTAEIVAQLIEVCRIEDGHTPRARAELASFDNIVVMGMGEPLANYDNLIRALKIANAPWALGFGARRITISTSGLVPEIRRLAQEPFGFRLAISLHGATNDVRQKIMPINRKYPLEELLPAVRLFAQRHGRMVTLEFILIEDVNDSLEQAHGLSEIARDLHAHVNVIPYNTVEGLDWKRPNMNRQRAFESVLRRDGVSVTVRREKGGDIAAACGQLRLKEERDGKIEPAPMRATARS